MVLDILTLTVELVVDEPVGLGLGAVETALDDVASRSRTGLLGQAEAEALHVALRKHGWKNQLVIAVAAHNSGIFEVDV